MNHDDFICFFSTNISTILIWNAHDVSQLNQWQCFTYRPLIAYILVDSRLLIESVCAASTYSQWGQCTSCIVSLSFAVSIDFNCISHIYFTVSVGEASSVRRWCAPECTKSRILALFIAHMSVADRFLVAQKHNVRYFSLVLIAVYSPLALLNQINASIVNRLSLLTNFNDIDEEQICGNG